MSKLLHLKASNVKILNTLPNRDFGKDGDIVISNIKGKGTFLCSKAKGIWFVSNRMSEISRLDKTPLNVFAKKINIKDIKNSSKGDKFIVIENDGELKYRTSEELLSDINSDAMFVNYKTAYCSLGQYTNKEECEANNGTWYYSENESHDSISSTAENQLLTIGQSIGTLDSEPTLLYDGSTLEIKRNTDYDDNWQTSAQDALLKLSYDSTNNTTVGISSGGDLTITPSGGDTTLSSSTLTIGTIAEVGSDTDKILMSDSGVVKYVTGANLRSYIGAGTSSFGGALNDLSDVTYSSGDLTISSLDTIVASGTLKLKLGDGDQSAFNLHSDDAGASQPSHAFGLELDNYSSFRMNEMGGSSNTDYFDILVNEHGATTISTVDAASTNADLTFDVDGAIKLDAASYGMSDGIEFLANGTEIGNITGHHNATYFTLYENVGASTDDVMTLYVKEHGETYLQTTDAASNNANFRLHVDGDIKLNPYGGGNIQFYIDAGFNNLMLDFKGASHFLAEQADAVGDNAGFGQLWVHDDAPNTLWFTNDAGNDIQLTDGAYNVGQFGLIYQFGGYSRPNDTNHVYVPSYGGYYAHIADMGTVGTALGDTSGESYIANYRGYVCPKAMTLTNFNANVRLYNQANANVYACEFVVMKGTPSDNSSANITMTTIGIFSMSLDNENRNNVVNGTWDTSHDNIAAGDLLLVGIRRTEDDGDDDWNSGETYYNKYYLYFSYNIWGYIGV